ncbi:MAG: branched-chain amino acid transport system substrate-binding protein, partial [Halocynthiibacter sp.]
MKRRSFLNLVSALTIASAMAATAASAENIRIGAVAPKT